MKRLLSLLTALLLAPFVHADVFTVQTSLDEIPWNNLGTGKQYDEVKIPYRTAAWPAKWQLNQVGVKFTGVADPLGRRPKLDGNGAKSAANTGYGYAPLESYAVIMVCPGHGEDVGNITIQGFDLVGLPAGATFVNAAGVTTPYLTGCALIGMYRAHDIAIVDCLVHDNLCGNGIFGKSYNSSYGGKNVHLANVRIERCTIFGNGVVGKNRYHGTYIEAAGVQYVGNDYGPAGSGALGSALKDRSSACVVRGNYVHGGARLLDLVEPQDGYDLAAIYDAAGNFTGLVPEYVDTKVESNLFVNDESSGRAIHFGGDSGVHPERYRPNLYFTGNVYILRGPQIVMWRSIVFDCTSNDQHVYCSGNRFLVTNSKPPLMCLLDQYGQLNFRDGNSIMRGFQQFHDGVPTYGTITGLETVSLLDYLPDAFQAK